jgi:hypothetical protein
MLIPDRISKCVAFLAIVKNDDSSQLVGTAFFLGRQIGPKGFLVYVVTAKHVIDKARDLGCDKIYLRMNGKSGILLSPTYIRDWICHPDASLNVDAAVLRFAPPPGADHLPFPLDGCITNEFMERAQVGMGEEVFFPGLFVHHYGTDRNVPVVRIGNIAAMPEGLVKTGIGEIVAYLIEARSVGGFSGSPVFLNQSLVRSVNGQVGFATNYSQRSGHFYLMGLVHGHFKSEIAGVDLTIEDNAREEKINAGIAIVVPITQVLEIINQPLIRDKEAPIERELARRSFPALE